jgi:hypothetical protein
MYDNLKSYFVENILILLKEYLKIKKTLKLETSNDLRVAINLSSALYHFREHFPIESKKSRKTIGDNCSDYNLLGDIVNASKHKIIDNNNPRISDAKNIYEEIVCTKYIDNLGEYNHIEKTVIVKLNDDSERNLHEININVLNMWIRELKSLGILENTTEYKYKSNRIPRRNKNSGKLHMYAMQNLRFGPRFKIQYYNYETKKIEPVNLTDAEINMRVYKPIHTITLTAIRDDNTKTEIDIDLDDIEFKQYNKLKSENDQINFIINKARKLGLVK